MNVTIHEIYFSIQGEGLHAGLPCVFVRTAGCNLRCVWCDTPEALTTKSGTKMAVAEVRKAVAGYPAKLVQITGGEPLLQKNIGALVEGLLADGYEILLETAGNFPVTDIPQDVHIILDVKCPGSGESQKNHLPNLELERPNMQYKFVLSDRGDFDFMTELVKKYGLDKKGTVLASPEFGRLPADKLCDWIKDSGIPVRLNLQQHKYIWGANARSV